MSAALHCGALLHFLDDPAREADGYEYFERGAPALAVIESAFGIGMVRRRFRCVALEKYGIRHNVFEFGQNTLFITDDTGTERLVAIDLEDIEELF